MNATQLHNAIHRFPVFLASFLTVILVSACVQNPVTGKNDLLLVSEGWELQIGAQQYLPLRQQQGGDYTADPKVENYVRSVGMKLAAKSDRKLPYEFNVINDSTPNAWALPGGKISINRGLLVELKNEDELAAVLGHEIVHAAAKHGARGQTRGIGLQLGVVTATILAQQNGYDGQVAQLASSVGAQIINSQYGQGAELEADRYGMEYMSRAGYDPQGAVELQRTFVRLSEGQGDSNPLSRLFASHPPSQKRVEANIETAAALPRGGVKGEAEYKRVMATLIKNQDAYAAHDRAELAIKNGNLSEASSLVKRAIQIEPRESRFYTLEGDIALAQRNTNGAIQAYDKAINLNGEYFYNYVKRGQIYEAQNNVRAAQADYARSIKLLPTATAQLGLGKFAEAQGNTQVARRYYSMAAQAGGNEGQTAQQALAGLQPETSNTLKSSLLVRQGLASNGTFAIEIINQTARPIQNVKLGVKAGNAPQRELNLRKLIPSGGREVIETGQKLTRAQANQIRVVILSAQ